MGVRKKSILAGVIIAAAAAVAVYIIAVTALFPNSGTGTENPVKGDYSDVYGIQDGDIVKFNLNSQEPETVHVYGADDDIVEAVKTQNYTVYTTDKDEFYQMKSAGEPEIIDSEFPSYYSLTALQSDHIAYLIPRVEILEEEDNYSNGEGQGYSEPHEIFYSIATVMNLEDNTVTYLALPDGTQLKAESMSVSPAGDKIVVTDLNGETYLFNSEGEHQQKLPFKISKIGFLDSETLWYSDILGPDENKDQHLKLYDIKTQKTKNLYETNPELSNMSVLDLTKIGDTYILLSNSYKSGTPKQTVFSLDKNYENMTGVVTLSSLSLNSNGKITPASNSEYMIDVRSSSNYEETATFKLSINTDETVIYGKVSQIFSPISK